MNELTGSALNGDPFGRGDKGGAVRWSAATSTWERVGNPLTLAPAFKLSARCEDAAGTIYGEVVDNGIWMLPAGAKDWIKMPPMDGDTDSDRPFVNNKGDVVIQSHRVTPDTNHLRVYRKPAGSTAWTLAGDRTLDSYNVVGLADNGDAFFANKAQPDQSPTVLQAGADAMKPLADGTGTTILPYCGLPILVSAAGDALFYGGGLGTRHLYSMKSSPTYPTTAEAIYDLPNDTCCFNGGQALLPDGTVVARMNMGGYDP